MPSVSAARLRAAIRRLTPDQPVVDPAKWYLTQHEHWLGWLGQYTGPGAYGRKNPGKDARFAYNHIVEPKMLIYLIQAAGIPPSMVKKARLAAKGAKTMMSSAAAIRRVVPWEEIQARLWP